MRTRAQRFGKRIGGRLPLTGIVLTLAALVPVGTSTAQEPAFWERSLNGFANQNDQALSVAVDRGLIVVAGFIRNIGFNTEFTVAKLGPTGLPLWQRAVHGTAVAGNGVARSVAVDGLGNIVVAGFVENARTGSDFTVAKLDPAGNLLWQRSLNGSAGQGDEASAVAVDGQGNVIAVGALNEAGAGDDFAVAKYTPAGTLVWRQTVGGSANGEDKALSVVVDSQGNVAAAGFTLNTDSQLDFTVAKFSAAGARLWKQTLNGTADGSFDGASSVALDGQGNVVVAGSTENVEKLRTGEDIRTGPDFTVAKLDRDGALLWKHLINGTANGFDQARSVAVDGQGNVIAAGSTTNISSEGDLLVTKIDPNGVSLWRRTLSGTPNGTDLGAFSVAVDLQGNIVTAGSNTKAGTGADFTVVKLNRDGTRLWERSLNGTANGTDQAVSVAVDGQGNVIAAGSVINTGAGSDFTVARFSRDGLPLWEDLFHGAVGSIEGALSVALDRQGNAIAVGSTHNTPDRLWFTVAKYNPDGVRLWEQPLPTPRSKNGFARAVAVDSQGNVVAVGQDFMMVKFDPNGVPLWQQSLRGTANGSDEAFSVAVDSRDNIVVAGFTENTETGRDFTVVKLGPNGNEIWRSNLDISNESDQAHAVAVDGQGNVVAVGVTTHSQSARDFTVVKFNPAGALQWHFNVNGIDSGDDRGLNDEGISVAVDRQGNAIVGGNTSSSPSTQAFTVAKFGPGGNRLWVRRLGGTAGGIDRGVASVAVDGQGNTIAAGSTTNAGTGEDFTVAKFGPDGAPLWLRTLNGTANGIDHARSAAVDSVGNVAVGGSITNTGTNGEFAVVKFNPDGFPLWHRSVGGSADEFDQALSVAVDGRGDVVAAGTTVNRGTDQDFTVAKFAQ